MIINIDKMNCDEIWGKIQKIVPDKYLSRWLYEKDIKALDKKILIFNGEYRLSLSEKLKILNTNGYNILYSHDAFDGSDINAVKIME